MHCATDGKAAVSIPGFVIVIFHLLNPSGHTSSLRFTQSPSEISTRGISSRIKAAGAWG